jgi:hypothetical protein
VHLPEPVGLDEELVVEHRLAHRQPGCRLASVGVGDQAVVDGDHAARAVGAETPLPLGCVRPLHPGAPAEAFLVAGHRLDGDVDIEAGEPTKLLGDNGSLEIPLCGEGCVLEVAASAQARTRDGAGSRHPIRRRREHGDGVTAPEPVAVVALGDLHDHRLAGQAVPGEDHARLGLGQSNDAVATMGHRADGRLEALSDPRASAFLACPGTTSHGSICRS